MWALRLVTGERTAGTQSYVSSMDDNQDISQLCLASDNYLEMISPFTREMTGLNNETQSLQPTQPPSHHKTYLAACLIKYAGRPLYNFQPRWLMRAFAWAWRKGKSTRTNLHSGLFVKPWQGNVVMTTPM